MGMNLYCPICGEPWDLYALHDVDLEKVEQLASALFPLRPDMTEEEWHRNEAARHAFLKARRLRTVKARDEYVLLLDPADAWNLFQRYGCLLFGCEHLDPPNKERAEEAALVYMMVSHPDDAASLFEDFFLTINPWGSEEEMHRKTIPGSRSVAEGEGIA